MSYDVLKIILPAVFSFCIGVALTPFVSDFLYKKQMWKKKAKTIAIDGHGTPMFNSLHSDRETKTPRLGGVIVWGSIALTGILLWILGNAIFTEAFSKFDFISRDQTWIPFATLLLGALVGLIDDVMEIKGGTDHKAGGLSVFKRLFVVASIGFFVGMWFINKLGVDSISLLWLDPIHIGYLIVPYIMFVFMCLYAAGVIDGLDGLAGGVFASIFAAYAVIAFSNGQINLAAFCATVVGGLLAFLWFNVPPARFYMSETGSMALTITLGVVAVMTDELGDGVGLSVLPIIAFPLVVTVLTDVIQIASKKIRGKKVFLIAPIHHHFEALGWSASKVTMRYWIISVICAIFGLIIALST